MGPATVEGVTSRLRLVNAEHVRAIVDARRPGKRTPRVNAHLVVDVANNCRTVGEAFKVVQDVRRGYSPAVLR